MTIIGVSLGATAQERTISGIVISGDDNEPIVGATVMVVGTTIGTTTDIDGRFTIQNTNLRRINEGLANLNDCARLRKWNKILMIAVTVLFVISAGTIYWVVSLRSERNELVKVEWLYRYVRPSIRNPNTIADIESRMFDGSDAQRDSIKSDAFTREVNGLPFRSFTLHDDWKPEPPEQEKAKTESEEEDSGGWFDWITRKTPQEEAALRDVRNNPNITEGAKP